MPYVSTWLSGSSHAYLVRASAGDPEITIVPVLVIENIQVTDEESLSEQLAKVFAEGAREFGIRLLGEDRIKRQ